MMIKLGIIVCVLILVGLVFYNDIGNLFPSTTLVINEALTDDITNLGDRASDSLQEGFDESIGAAGDIITDGINNASQHTSEQLHQAGETSKDTVTDVLSNINPVPIIEDLVNNNTEN